MDIFNNSYYKWNKFLLSSIGLWPYQTIRARLLPYSIMLLGIGSFSIPQIANLIENIDDVDSVFSALPMTFGAFIMSAKVIITSINQKKMKFMLDEIQKDWIDLANTEEFEILKEYSDNNRKMTIYYGTFAIFPAFLYILWPLFVPILDVAVPINESRARYFIHPAEYFVDQDKYYYFILLNEYFSYVVDFVAAAGTDTSYFLFVEHACGMFVALCHRLENIRLDETPKELRNTEEIEKVTYLRVISCIKFHIKTKQFCNLVISVYSMFLLFDIGPGLLMHSALCVLIVLNLNKTNRLGQFVIVLISQSVRLFLNSWPGQRLIDHSLKIYISAYNAPWYSLPAKARRMFIFLIMESQKPHTINFANLYVVNMDSFGMVIRTSLSYCTVMASIHDSM